MIIAKTVIPNQFWILRHNDKKIGNIESGPGGFQVRINNTVQQYPTIGTLKRDINIQFETVVTTTRPKTLKEVNGYHTTTRPYNAIYVLKHQVPLWTKEPRSKSWYAAGWYLVKQGRSWETVECPKLIMLNRYEYRGPFVSEAEAKSADD